MKATMAIMARDVMARRELPLLAVAVAIMISLLPYLPHIETYEATDVRTVASSVSALALGCVLALVFGATVFGSDLSEGRLGFFFARPVSGLAVWWGRVFAVMALIWIVEIIVLVPAFFHVRMRLFTSSDWVDWLTALAYVIAPLLLFLLAHVVSIVVRAGTSWMFLDLGGVLVVALFAWLNLRPLYEIGAPIALSVVAGALLAGLLISLTVGGASGVAVGRVDLRRVHSAQALALWSTMAICVAGITTYSNWLRDFTPRHLENVDVISVAPNGQWVEAMGGAPRRFDIVRKFLISTTDQRWLSMTPFRSEMRYRGVAFSDVVSKAAWLGDGEEAEPRSIWFADLDDSPPRKRQTTLIVSETAHLTLSPDGDRLAVVEGSTLSFYQVDNEALLTAVRLPEDLHNATLFFLSSEIARLYGATDGESKPIITFAEVDVETGQIERTGLVELEDNCTWYWTLFDADLKQIAFRGRFGEDRKMVGQIHDARTGEFIRTVDNFKGFLADGRVVSFREEDDTSWLDIDSVEETAVTLDLGPWEDVAVCGEPSIGELVVIRRDQWSLTGGPVVIDTSSGAKRSISEDELICRGAWQWKPGSLTGTRSASGPLSGHLFVRDRTSLVRWDPETGEMVHVVGGGD